VPNYAASRDNFADDTSLAIADPLTVAQKKLGLRELITPIDTSKSAVMRATTQYPPVAATTTKGTIALPTKYQPKRTHLPEFG
jgi:hypothetical protein